jgi:hypothetical protein
MENDIIRIKIAKKELTKTWSMNAFLSNLRAIKRTQLITPNIGSTFAFARSARRGALCYVRCAH